MGEAVKKDEHQLLIGGKWVDASGGTYDIVNPATEEDEVGPLLVR